jgi:hypothetical protein
MPIMDMMVIAVMPAVMVIVAVIHGMMVISAMIVAVPPLARFCPI